MVVFDHGQPKREVREGITFYAHTFYVANRPITPVASAQVSPNNSQTITPAVIPNQQQLLRQKLYPLLRRLPSPLFAVARWLYNLLRSIKRQWYLSNRFEIIGPVGHYIIEKEKIAIYEQINADIYLLPGNNHVAAELAFFCRKRRKKYIFLAGSDNDYQAKERLDRRFYSDLTIQLLGFSIEHATAHIVQSEGQAQLLQQHYGRTSTIIRNPIDLTHFFPRNATANIILWIGKSDTVKRPEIILDLAGNYPEYHFLVIMNLWDQDIYDRCVSQAKILPNVTMIHYVLYTEIERYFAQATLFVNTSVFEGFPNTFLQAAKYGVPIVSLQVDPGQMLSKHGCGLLCTGDFERLKENVCRFMTVSSLYEEASAHCLEYVRTYHDKDKIMTQYESTLISTLAPAIKTKKVIR